MRGAARPLARGLALIALLLAVAWAFNAGWFGLLPDRDWIDRVVRGQGGAGVAAFVALGGLFTALGLPRQVLAFLGGYGFGWLAGAGLATLGALAGCMLGFAGARLAFAGLRARTLPPRLARARDFIDDNTFLSTLMVRLLPAGSNLLVNLAAGAGGIRAAPFFAGSLLGYVPQMLIFALIGSGVRVDPGARIAAGTLLFLLSGILGLYLYRRYRGAAGVERGL